MDGETREVRATEDLDWTALAAYLRLHLPHRQLDGLDVFADMKVSQFPGGHSNLTYLVRLGGAEVVIRRPPLGPIPPRAHDMAREFRWLAALHPVFPLAPRPYLLCEDTAVIGSVFYAMERRHGIVVRHDEPPGLADRPEERRRVSEAIVDTLADLHAVNAMAPPLAALGKPQGFLMRQVRGWTERWERAQTSEIADMHALAGWLAERLPPDPEQPSIVHGDFKLDNVLLDPLDHSRIVAVLDWEMSAIGDPLVDLGILLAYWTLTAPADRHDALSTVTGRPGWFTPDRILDRYAGRSGRDLSNIRFYQVFALFKIAVVIQQIFYRYTRRQTDDPRFAAFGERVTSLAREAVSLT
ncbi:MAG: phosphotransferase [Luteitalea sp.]|nr:phosphotransferase [Luteitalea sp.]